MTTLGWPVDLPSCFIEGSYNEGLPDNLVRDDFDGAPDALRRRSTSASFPLTGSMVMTTAEWADLRSFFRDTLFDGALKFSFPVQGYFLDSPALYWAVRFTAPPSRQRIGESLWSVTLSLEVLGDGEAPGPTWLPSDIVGVIGWYEADLEASNTAWGDQSGNNNDMTVSAAITGVVLNATGGPHGGPSMDFDASADVGLVTASIPTTADSTFTVFAVFKSVSGSGSNARLISLHADPGDANDYDTTSSVILLQSLGGDDKLQVYGNGASRTGSSASALSDSTWYIAGIRATGSLCQVYNQTTQLDSDAYSSFTLGAANSPDGIKICLGSYEDGNTDSSGRWGGSMVAAFVSQDSISDDDMALLVAYWQDKWGPI